MSGVFPGVRTKIFQRLRLMSAGDARWAQLAWYDEPQACVLTLSPQYALPDATETAALLRIEDPSAEDLLGALQTGLAECQRTLQACATCRFWQRGRERTVDGLPVGICHWRLQGLPEQQRRVSTEISDQSGLALACVHWQEPANVEDFASEAEPSSAIPAPRLDEQSPPTGDPLASEVTAHSPVGFDRLSPQGSELLEQESIVGRIRRWFGRKQPQETAANGDASSIRLSDRSGVGAGTEPCFGCNGRMANLGALTAESAEGDKQTYSVWRCRSCYTFYLNSWIDRWERLDTLETVETHYRIAPAEALMMLEQIQARPGSDHPRLRAERFEERAWFEQFTQNRDPISHQVKQGR